MLGQCSMPTIPRYHWVLWCSAGAPCHRSTLGPSVPPDKPHAADALQSGAALPRGTRCGTAAHPPPPPSPRLSGCLGPRLREVAGGIPLSPAPLVSGVPCEGGPFTRGPTRRAGGVVLIPHHCAYHCRPRSSQRSASTSPQGLAPPPLPKWPVVRFGVHGQAIA